MAAPDGAAFFMAITVALMYVQPPDKTYQKLRTAE